MNGASLMYLVAKAMIAMIICEGNDGDDNDCGDNDCG